MLETAQKSFTAVELSLEEIDNVNGGMLPLIIAGAFAVGFAAGYIAGSK